MMDAAALQNVDLAIIVLACIAYGVVLKKKRDRRRNLDDSDSNSPPAESTTLAQIARLIGICLIGAGVLVSATVAGSISNVPPLSPWGLALTASIVMCFMGCLLSCFLKCCYGCKNTFNTFLCTQLIES